MPTSLPSRANQTSEVISRLGQYALAAYLLSIVALCGLLVVNGPQLRAAAEAQEAHITEEENRAFCIRFGIAPETPRYAQCAGELTQIRARHLQRHIGESIL